MFIFSADLCDEEDVHIPPADLTTTAADVHRATATTAFTSTGTLIQFTCSSQVANMLFISIKIMVKNIVNKKAIIGDNDGAY